MDGQNQFGRSWGKEATFVARARRVTAASRLALLLAFAASAPMANAQAALTPRQIADRYRASVVSVRVKVPAGESSGTGFFYQDDRTVATCYHVIHDAERIEIVARDGTTWRPALVAYDAAADVALLRLPAGTGRRPIPHGPSQEVFPGDPVVAIGDPLGLVGTVSAGVVGALRREGSAPVVQFTAPISPGSSGGPLIDGRGRAIGLVRSIYTEGQNLNVAVSAAVARAMFDDFGRGIEDQTHFVMGLQDFYNVQNPFWEPTFPDAPKRSEPKPRGSDKEDYGGFADLIPKKARKVGRLARTNAVSTVYAAPYSPVKRLARLPKGGEVAVVDRSYDWSQVRLSDGRLGYVRSATLDNLPYDVMSDGKRVFSP